MQFKQFAVSWKKVASLGFSLLVSTFISSMIVIIPFGVKEVKSKYYANLNYNLENDYQQPITNSPISTLTTYNDENSWDSIFPYAIGQNNGTPIPIDEMDGSDANVINALGYSAMYLKNKHFSINALDDMLDQLSHGNINSDKYADAEGILTDLFATFLPAATTGQVSNANWKDSYKNFISSRIPSEILPYWNSNEFKNRFSIDFQSSKLLKNDSLYSYFWSKSNQSDIKMVGLENDKLLNLDLNEIQNPNDVIATSKLLNTLDKKVGDTFETTSEIPMLQFWNGTEYQTIENDWWQYYDDDSKTFIPLTETDLSHYTFEHYSSDGKDNVGAGEISYYLDDNGELRKFYSASNIYLKIPKLMDTSVWNYDNTNLPNLFDNDVVDKNSNNDFYLIRPFSWKFGKNGKSISWYQQLKNYIMANLAEPDTWFDTAQKTNNSQSDSKAFIVTNNVSMKTNYHIVDEIKVYDKNYAYTTKYNVNSLLNIPVETRDTWFNGKLSSEPDYPDLFQRVGLMVENGNLSFNALSNIKGISKGSDFLGKKIEVIDVLYNFVVKLVIIFLAIIILITLISMSVISNIFIQQFYKTIMLFKVMGYKNAEIHRIILGVFLPLNIFVVFIASFIPSIISMIVINILAAHGTLIPLSFIWSVPIIVSIVMMAIFVSIYFINYRRFIGLNIQEQITKD